MMPSVPDYQGLWVGGLLPGLCAGEPAPWVPTPARAASAVVVLVLDGLGWRMVERHRQHLPTLAGMEGGPITTVAPSTTASALTSITTGATPSEHGVVGYRFRVGGEVMNALRWQFDGDSRGPKPTEVQPLDPFSGEDVPVVSRSEFATTGFTAAHLRGGTLHGWRTPATLVTYCRRLLASGQRLIYAYYDGVDRVAHAHGLNDEFLVDELRATDRLIGDVLEALPAGTALLITADHGQVHVGPEGQRGLDDLDPFIAAYSGEGRFRSLHARTGATKDLLEAAQERFGDLAWVRSREQLLVDGWLGPGMRPTIAGRLGDVVLAAKEPVAFVDPGFQQEAKLMSMHGSLTPDEIEVPLLAAAGG